MDGDSISDGGSDLTADDILRLFADHVLLDVMKRWPSFEDDPPALGIVIELHNAGRLDLLSVADWPEWDQVSGHRFFDVQHFMDQAIPRLEADTDRMMAFVAALVAKGGNDGAARWPNVALTQWCERHPDQARAIVAKAETGEALAVDHLSFALHALGDLELARSTVLSSVGLRRLAALAGLARISHLTPELRAATVLLFDGLLASDVDDALRSSIANALVNIFDSANEALTAEAVNVVERAVSAGGEATLHSAARALFGNRAPQSIELVTILLIALRRLNSAEKGSVEILDVGLGDLVRRGFGVQAVDFLTEFLSRPDIELPLSEFRNFCASLFEGDQ